MHQNDIRNNKAIYSDTEKFIDINGWFNQSFCREEYLNNNGYFVQRVALQRSR